MLRPGFDGDSRWDANPVPVAAYAAAPGSAVEARKGHRVAGLHASGHLLLSYASDGAILDSYARTYTYLIAARPLARVGDCRRSHGLQVGGQRGRHSLQRPTASDAKEVVVQAAQSVTGPPISTSSSSSPPSAGARTYASCQLYQPENDEVFLNTSTVTCKAPAAAAIDEWGSSTHLSRRTAAAGSAVRSYRVRDLERGARFAHLTAMVTSASGTPVCTSSAVTFHVRQPSVQAPVKAVRPRF